MKFKVGDRVRYNATGNDFIPCGATGVVQNTVDDVSYAMVKFDDHEVGRWTVPFNELEYAENGIERALKAINSK